MNLTPVAVSSELRGSSIFSSIMRERRKVKKIIGSKDEKQKTYSSQVI
jgi:hypothetical protein